MGEVDFHPDWDKSSDIGFGKKAKLVPNHESSLTRDEMLLLVAAVLEIPGMKTPPDEMPAPIKELSVALQTGKVKVRKGIHQREDEVHFNLEVCPVVAGAYHIWVKADTPVEVADKGGKKTLFKYAPTGVSCDRKKVQYKWPATFVITKGNMPLGRARGTSFSAGNSAPAAAAVPNLTA